MDKKKIAFIVASPGSAEAFLTEHFLHLKKFYDITLIANFTIKPESVARFEAMGIKCISVPIERQISIVNDLKALFSLQRILRQGKYESVHSVTPKAGLLASVAGWFARVPSRIHIFTGQVWATRKGFMRVLLKFLDKIIVFFDTVLLVDGESQRQFLIKEGVLREKNSRVLANGSITGVRLDRFNVSEKTRREQRAKFGFADDDVVFVFMGRLNHDKGVVELYEAFDKIVGECPKSKLLMFGVDEGNFDCMADTFPNIRRNENYFYPGLTPTPYTSLQAGDVFVLPTWREGFGMSVIEASALKLPVITSDAYGVLSASIEGVTGLRCKVGDSNSLYECMKVYYNNPIMRKAHGEAGRKRVEDHFDTAVVCKAWVDFYNEILSK